MYILLLKAMLFSAIGLIIIVFCNETGFPYNYPKSEFSGLLYVIAFIAFTTFFFFDLKQRAEVKEKSIVEQEVYKQSLQVDESSYKPTRYEKLHNFMMERD